MSDQYEVEPLESRTFLSSSHHLRTAPTRHTRTAPPPPAVPVSSTFDTTADGWTVAGDPVSPTPSFRSIGSGQGYVFTTDAQLKLNMFWVAPAKFTGNKLAAYNGTLSFDQWQSIVVNQEDDADVILTGKNSAGVNTQLVFSTANNPGVRWTHYSVPLNETAGWKVGTLAGAAVTQADLKAVLTSLASVQIRAEFSNEADVDGLDNVVMAPPGV